MASQYPHLHINSESVLLERMLVSASAAVSANVLRDLAAVHRDHALGMAKVFQELSPLADHLLITMRTWLLKGQHVEQTITKTVQVPTSAWDHVKHDMLQSTKPWLIWLGELFKAPNYTTIVQEEIHETRVCPHNDTYFSDSQQHIRYMLWRADDNGNRLEERD